MLTQDPLAVDAFPEIPRISVEHLGDYCRENPHVTVLVHGDRFSRSIMERLHGMGVERVMDSYPLFCLNVFEYRKILENLERIKRVYDALADEVSKEIFLSVLEYRFVGDPTRLCLAPWPKYFSSAGVACSRRCDH